MKEKCKNNNNKDRKEQGGGGGGGTEKLGKGGELNDFVVHLS